MLRFFFFGCCSNHYSNKSLSLLLFCCSAVLLFCCSAVLLFCCSDKRVLLFREYLAFLFLTTNKVFFFSERFLKQAVLPFFLFDNVVSLVFLLFLLLKQNLVFFSLSSSVLETSSSSFETNPSSSLLETNKQNLVFLKQKNKTLFS